MRSQAHHARTRRLVAPSHRLTWATAHDEAQRLDVATCRYCKGRMTVVAQVAPELRRACVARPRGSGAAQKRYLVIGYDDDQQRACFETLAAASADDAVQELGRKRPDLTALVTALTAEELRELAEDLEKE